MAYQLNRYDMKGRMQYELANPQLLPPSLYREIFFWGGGFIISWFIVRCGEVFFKKKKSAFCCWRKFAGLMRSMTMTNCAGYPAVNSPDEGMKKKKKKGFFRIKKRGDKGLIEGWYICLSFIFYFGSLLFIRLIPH